MKRLRNGAIAIALLASTASTPAYAEWGSPGDGDNAYKLACALMWLAGYNNLCGELR